MSRVGKERWPSCRFLEPNEHRRLVATGRNRAITDKVQDEEPNSEATLASAFAALSINLNSVSLCICHLPVP